VSHAATWTAQLQPHVEGAIQRTTWGIRHYLPKHECRGRIRRNPGPGCASLGLWRDRSDALAVEHVLPMPDAVWTGGRNTRLAPGRSLRQWSDCDRGYGQALRTRRHRPARPWAAVGASVVSPSGPTRWHLLPRAPRPEPDLDRALRSRCRRSDRGLLHEHPDGHGAIGQDSRSLPGWSHWSGWRLRMLCLPRRAAAGGSPVLRNASAVAPTTHHPVTPRTESSTC
jgi:hypothetical protein